LGNHKIKQMIILNLITIFIGFFLVLSFGYLLSVVILPKAKILELMSLGYILGIGIFTLFWFLLNWAGIPYNLLSGFVLLSGLNILTLLASKVVRGKWFEKIKFDFHDFLNLTQIEKIGLGVLIFIFISVLAQCLYWPVHAWDSLVLYDFRAKVFVETGFMQSAIDRGYFFNYPLLTSLAHAWTYLLKGISPNILYAFWYLALLFNFSVNLKKLKTDRVIIIFLTLAVAISPRLFDHTQWAYTNLPYAIYITLGYIYLYFGMKNRDFGSYVISAILVGLSNWSRTLDPFWISAVIVAVVFPILMKKKLWPLAYLVIVSSLLLPWRMFQSINNQGVAALNPAPQALHNVVQNLNLPFLKIIFDFFVTNVVSPYLIYFVLLGVIIVTKFYIKSKVWLFAGLIVFDILLVFVGTVVLANNTVYWQDIPDSLVRMVMFLPVLILFLTGELLSEIKKG
jgi:hypothetical protein